MREEVPVLDLGRIVRDVIEISAKVEGYNESLKPNEKKFLFS